jgi:hypothetical protein
MAAAEEYAGTGLRLLLLMLLLMLLLLKMITDLV